MTLGDILLIFTLILLNGFFVAVEFAAVASRRARLDLLADPSGAVSQQVHRWLDQPASRERLIAATQLGITVVSLALGAVGENAFEAWLEPYFHDAHFPQWLQFLDSVLPALPLALSLIIVTSLHVVLGEQVPKVAVLRAPERFMLTAAPFMRIFIGFFRWFISVLDWATRAVLRIFGLPATSPHALAYSAEEIKEMVSGPEVEGALEPSEREMLTAVIDFGEMVVRQVALPRTEIIAVEASAPIEEIIRLATENAITKLPVYEENLDQITGVIHIRDVLARMAGGQTQGCCARDLAREALFVPETISVSQLLREFRARRMHIAIVLDEFGGTTGLVTLEDLLEEIVGEVSDPFDKQSPHILSQPDGSAQVDGMTLIAEVNEQLGLNLMNPHYDTLAGYLLEKLGRIPQQGEQYDDVPNGIRLTVTQMERLRIALVQIEKL